MRFLPKTLAAIGLAALLWPFGASGDQLPAPMEKKVLAGTSSIKYAGQTFSFTTTTTVKVRFEAVSATRIRLSIVVPSPGSPSPGAVAVKLMSLGTEIVSLAIPGDLPWEGVINCEGGFVER